MKNIVLTFIALALFCACDKALLGETEENTILNNFEYFWQDYKDHYGNFRVKSIDWDAQYARHRPSFDGNPTEEDLYTALRSMQEVLDDGHVGLFPIGTDFPYFTSGVAGRLYKEGFKDFDLDVIKENYLLNDYTEVIENEVIYATLPDNIGYIYLGLMFEDLQFWEETFDQMIEDLGDTKGIILDLRDNGGGEDEAGRLITSYFTDAETHYMEVRYKDGLAEDDFSEVYDWDIAPGRATLYTNPIVLLTNRYTISAGETFGFALKTLPQLTHIGDTTNGAFSDTVERELPNRWQYRVPVAEVFDGDGISWEGIGLIPDQVTKNTAADLEAGQDKMLETSIAVF